MSFLFRDLTSTFSSIPAPASVSKSVPAYKTVSVLIDPPMTDGEPPLLAKHRNRKHCHEDHHFTSY